MHLAPNELEPLIAAAKSGSKTALGELLERFQPDLIIQARLHLHAKVQVKVGVLELVQEAYVRALQGFHEFQGSSGDQMAVWLRRIVLHLASNANRRFRCTAKREIGLERPLRNDIAERPQAAEAENDEEIYSPWGRGEQGDLMRCTFHLLTADYQQIIALHYQDHLTHKEAALAMDRSVEAVKILLRRAVLCWRKEVKTLEKRRGSKQITVF